MPKTQIQESDEQGTPDILKKGRLCCPVCKSKLWFEQICGCRVIRAGFISAECPKCKTFYKVRG